MEAPHRVCPRCGGAFEGSAAFCPKDGTPLSAAADADAYVGQVLLGQFQVLARVGAGGMGTVYRARQIGVERDVAIKILHTELVQNQDAVRRFQREARVSAALDHPNVVRVFLFGQLPDGNLYIVMEYLEGKSLSDVLRTTGAMPVPRALHITTQICAAIGESHAQGVVHRDVKPENVHLVKRARDEDFVKVLDFGIARFLWGEQTMVTQSGLIFGTARYISPEGAAGEPTDARSDVYSLGVLCYQLLCGETPFDSPSPVALLMKHIHEPAPDIRTRAHGTHVPTAIADVLGRALAKSSDARWDDAALFGEALGAAATASGFVFGAAARRASYAPQEPVHAPRMDPTPLRVPLAQSPIERARSVVPQVAAARTPSTYENTTGGLSSLSIAGLPSRRKRSRFGVVILSFALGAAAVAGGALIAKLISQNEHEAAVAARHGQLVERANAALAAEAYDAPPGDNVLELTGQLLGRDPHDVSALGIRREAAERLDRDGDRARGDGLVEEAQASYRRALALVPQDLVAARGLAALETPAERLTLTVDPATPTAGNDVAIVATFAAGVHPDAAPTARILRGTHVVRTLALAAGDDPRVYRASYALSPAGEYVVEISAIAGGPLSARQTITVGPAQLAVRHGGADPQEHDPTGFVPTPNPTPGPIPPASSDGINWDAPPPPGGTANVQSAGTVVQDAPPPSWTANPI